MHQQLKKFVAPENSIVSTRPWQKEIFSDGKNLYATDGYHLAIVKHDQTEAIKSTSEMIEKTNSKKVKLELILNPKFLRNALDLFGEIRELKISIIDGKSPIVLTDFGDNNANKKVFIQPIFKHLKNARQTP